MCTSSECHGEGVARQAANDSHYLSRLGLDAV